MTAGAENIVNRDDPKKCPMCAEKLDWRTVERSPLENEWVPFCPSCGWGDADA